MEPSSMTFLVNTKPLPWVSSSFRSINATRFCFSRHAESRIQRLDFTQVKEKSQPCSVGFFYLTLTDVVLIFFTAKKMEFHKIIFWL